MDACALAIRFRAQRDDDVIGAGQFEVQALQRSEPGGGHGGEAQRVPHAFERRAEPRRGDRTQLGKRSKLRLEACNDGTVDGRDAAVRAM